MIEKVRIASICFLGESSYSGWARSILNPSILPKSISLSSAMSSFRVSRQARSSLNRCDPFQLRTLRENILSSLDSVKVKGVCGGRTYEFSRTKESYSSQLSALVSLLNSKLGGLKEMANSIYLVETDISANGIDETQNRSLQASLESSSLLITLNGPCRAGVSNFYFSLAIIILQYPGFV